ncbi:MAG: exo-alpha-sialidase [Clostridia bacterium]|nr:exo-alpha-sialidase [Clostridia bacterium]
MRKIGRQVNFIGTSEINPRNGEGSFIRRSDGSIVFAYTEFVGDDWEDDAVARISATVSYDEGENWGEKHVLFNKPDEAKNIMSFSFLRMNNGDIGAFYIIKNADETDQIVFCRSADEGKSWSSAKNCLDCLDEQDYYVINNDRVIKLPGGRILFAAARHTVLTEHKEFMPGVICFFVSDDDGETFRKIETEFSCPFPKNPDGYEEPGLYVLPDGKIWCYIRTSLGFQFESFSTDNGESWSVPEPNIAISSACSPMLVKDCGKYTVAVFNPEPEHLMRDENEPWGRTPYVIAISSDRGRTFEKHNVFYLEDDRNNGYCYPAITETKDGFLVAYYHSNSTGICLNSTKVIKITFDELEYAMRKSLVESYQGKTVRIVMDRPLGYVHKKENYTLVYPINYGCIPDVIGGDGEELDVYLLGVDEAVDEYTAKIIGIVHRRNDVEDKLVAAPEGMNFTKEEIEAAVRFQEQYYDSEVEVAE